MNRILPIMLLLLAAPAVSMPGAGPGPPPSREEVESMMGLPSRGDRIRGVKDTVGFVVTAAQAEEVVKQAVDSRAADLRDQDKRLGMSSSDGFLGGICPHDDHLYASRVYIPLTQRISAPRVILIGVFHQARLWGLENRLVFDSFESWHGPWGAVKVDPLRNELLKRLPADSVVIDNSMHALEHSLEAIIPFLQFRNREVSIVPILAPYMDWTEMSTLSDELADALSAVLESNGWQLGRDVAIVISSDAVHYGDDFDHAPFGTDAEGYLQAVERDHRLIDQYLTGPLRAARLHELFGRLVDESDVRRYLLPWCGRFSVPFGLEVLRKTAANLDLPAPVGHRLSYGTSLSEPTPQVSQSGLGYTAPSNFHHWVGYAAVGYLPEVAGED